MEAREDLAWLHSSRFNPHPISGTLELADGELTFTIGDPGDDEDFGWLEKHLDADGLAARLASGETVVAFSHSLDDCNITWPITGGGAMMVVDAPSRKWYISYDQPSGGAVLQTITMLSGRSRARQWKKTLAAAEGDGSGEGN